MLNLALSLLLPLDPRAWSVTVTVAVTDTETVTDTDPRVAADSVDNVRRFAGRLGP